MLAAVAATTLLLGHSVEHRPIRAHRSGDGPTRVLVIGSIHGDEPGGHAVVRALRRRGAPEGIELLTIRTANPDGLARGTRTNARGVDLNRNFPHRWAPGPRGRYFPGPRAASEPETRALMRFLRRVRPHLTIHYHQPYGFVVDTPTIGRRQIRRYARLTGMPVRRLPRYRGTVAGWQRKRGQRGFVVELGPSARHPSRHARAVLKLATGNAMTARVRPPAVKRTPIPFGTRRKRQMRRYARRHYALNTHLLKRPRTIVQHYTASSTFVSAFNTFAANRRDPELGELPGVCAHFLIDVDGTIHQLVDTRFMCRHVIGLNHAAIGVEHVGTSDAQVMGNRRMLRSSLRLTRHLMDRYGIPRRHVIGHAESLRSPFHHERVRALRRRTHGDFPTRVMRRYRARLRAAASRRYSAPQAAAMRAAE